MEDEELHIISVLGSHDDDDDEEPNTFSIAAGDKKKKKKKKILIPGLPDDIAEQCLLRIPYPYQAPVRAVSSSWNTLIKDPAFVLSKNYLSLSVPYIFVMSTFHNSSTATARIHWHALDPRSGGSWFVLPPMPPVTFTPTPSSLACASVHRLGQLFVLGGSDTDSSSSSSPAVLTYHVSSNRWSVRSPMRTPRAFFTAESVAGGKIVAIGGCAPDNPSSSTTAMISSVECYDPTTDTWTEAAEMSHMGLAKYDSAVIESRVYMTEGWTWPFMFVPRGAVYDAESDTWREMSEGMREGWTGFSIVMWNRLFVMSEHGDHRLKVYVPETDTWCYVGGDKFPSGALQKPFAVTSGGEGTIYVISSGLNLGVGRVSTTTVDSGGGGFSVEWKVVAAPKAFRDLSPCNAQLLYA